MDVVEFIETYFDIELFEWQKIFLRKAVNEPFYITFPPRCGKTYFMELINEWNELNKSKN